MSENNAPPIIFDPALKALRQHRAQKRQGRFLLTHIAKSAAGRIEDINRTFNSALISGHSGFKDQIIAHLPEAKKPSKIYTELKNCSPASLDIALSLLELQSENDPIGHLIQIHEKLKPDGLLIAAMFGGETLDNLKQAFYAFDLARFDGVTARVFPLINHIQAEQLLGRAGFALPVIDKDSINVNYTRLQTLISDIRDIGETNFLTMRKGDYLGRDIYPKLEALYPLQEGTSKFPAKFEILWLSGWTPHESQQKPLKPGSAKIHLSEALKPKD